MRNSKLQSASGWTLFGLGCLHQLVHIMFELNPEKPPLVAQMENFKIEMIGTHSLLEFHTGFSLFTGFLLIILGLVIAFLSKTEVPKKVDFLILASLITIIIVSILYIHALAYGVTFISLVLFLLAAKKQKTS